LLNLTFLIDALFAVLAITLLRNIFFKNTKTLIIPFGICVFTIATLLFFYISNTTEIANVWLNSHATTPLIYKIAGLWGNHEGSMLLFFTFLTAWSALLLRETDAIRIASLILLALGCYLYFQANPFVILAIKATAGQDLNPALQNPYLAIHPPILYMGQSLCLVLWAWACVGPNHPKLQAYTRVSFGLITLGLILGSRWAYGELGWGGFWFWDPVETVSLFPWLAIIAAVHAKESNRTCLLLSFPMVMLGLTLVRSGVLVSVHSFGFDLNNGVWLGLCTILVWAVTTVVFFKGKIPKLSLITIGFLSCLAVLVALILLPILLNYGFGINTVIDEGFFHQYINPLTLVLLIFAGFAPYMKFRNHGWNIICTILATTLWVWLIQPRFQGFAALAALVGFWLIFSTISHLKQFFSKGFVSAHLGIGLSILGASHAEFSHKKLR
jgi:cytochrome c-type biogenesis protein CcmF